MGLVEALCTSEGKGERKKPVPSAVFREDHGIESDAHAGPWHRQVSLLAAEDIESVRRNGLSDIEPGDFAENVIVAGLDLGELGLGSRLQLGGDVVLEISQIGKVCHSPCRIYYLTGDCIMPRLGLFARVRHGGTVAARDPAELLGVVPRERFQAVVLTVSNRCSCGAAEDTAGPAAAGRLRSGLDAHIYRMECVPDEQERITDRLRHYCEGHSIDLVVTVGGTGFSPRDVTPEATRTVVDRLTPGLDEAMRSASRQDTPHAVLSRGVSGTCSRTLIINLPGSEIAATQNLDVILPALCHGLMKLRGDASDCGRPLQRTTSYAR
jgi:molybdopterin adenylyltransferase